MDTSLLPQAYHLRYFFAMLGPLFLFLLGLVVLLRTLVPTIYTLDSAEFITGAKTLGFVHAPGYPLYLLMLHGFLKLPLGDVGVMGNVFSALCLALTIPLLYLLLCKITESPRVAMSAALIFAWSSTVWLTGLFAEVYSLQLLTLTLGGLAVYSFYSASVSRKQNYSVLVGFTYGLAVAVHPIAILFAPGLILAFRLMKISWRASLVSGGLAALIFLSTLLYFPIRAAENPELNMAGQYDWQGNFQAQDLSTLKGLWWMLSGQQFDSLMFEHGVIPTLNQISQFLRWFIENWLGFGFFIGLGGMVQLYRQNRGVLAVWSAWFFPMAYFYMTYGAQDRNLMLAPLYLLWAVVLAVGLEAFDFPALLKTSILIGLPLLMLVVHFPRLDLSDDSSVRDRSEAMLAVFPENALVFGEWRNAGPLEYYQVVKHQRQDINIYNLFLFPKADLQIFVEKSVLEGKPVVFTEGEYARELLGEGYEYQPLEVNWSHPDFAPLDVVEVSTASQTYIPHPTRYE